MTKIDKYQTVARAISDYIEAGIEYLEDYKISNTDKEIKQHIKGELLHHIIADFDIENVGFFQVQELKQPNREQREIIKLKKEIEELKNNE